VDVFETRGDEELRLLPSVVWCDAAEYEECVRAREHARAIALYRGPLLPGFVAIGAPGFQGWLELTRRRFTREAVKSALILAEEHAARLECTAVGDLAQFIVQREPDLDDEHQLRKLIGLLARMGDRVGALRLYEAFRERLWIEFEAEPAAETRALMENVRRR
jgi:DNA-binding SARP family transcriptional activator